MARGPVPPSVPSRWEFKSMLVVILLPLTNHCRCYVQCREAEQSAYVFWETQFQYHLSEGVPMKSLGQFSP